MGAHQTVALQSSAPAHWPSISTVYRPGLPGFRDRLTNALANARIAARPLRRFRERVFAHGILPVFEIVEGRNRYAAFAYADATPEAGGHFAAARDLLAPLGVQALWYCREPLTGGEPANPLVAFAPHMICRESTSRLKAARLAMWWPTPEQPRFRSSAARELVTRIYHALDGIEASMLGELAGPLELPPASALPRKERAVPVEGPEERTLLFAASAEKGVRFAFPIDSTPILYRDGFLRAFAGYCEARRAALVAGGVSPVGDAAVRPVDWWTYVDSACESEDDVIVGAIESQSR